MTRERHPTDRRATLLALTERGAASLAEMDKGHRDLAALLFGDMAERELGAFVDALGHVTSPLREGLQAAGEGGR